MRPGPVLFLALAAASVRGAAAAPPPAPTFRLRPSDVAVYDVAPVTVGPAGDVLGPAETRTVFGHELRDGLYAPIDPRLDDLPSILAFHLPKALEEGETPVARRVPLVDAAPVAAKGTVTATPKPDGTVELGFRWTFEARGPLDKDAPLVVDQGVADGTTTFDPARGVPTAARLRMSSRRRKAGAGKAEAPTRGDGIWAWRLREVVKARPPGFDAEVAAALDAGARLVRSWQLPDGSYPAFGDHDVGTTALCVLTLAACGVPRTDPAVERGLVWLGNRALPRATYPRALALMAFDQAYTPPGEDALLAAGRIEGRIRALRPDHRAWCRRVAEALERDVESPGSWGYPSAPNALLKFDSSNTQYGALGLRAAVRLGFPVRDTTWFGLTRHFEVVRERKGPRASLRLEREGDPAPDAGETAAAAPAVAVPEAAGFLYSTRETRPWASMVAAGIGSLELARHELLAAKSPKATAAFVDDVERRVLAGWAWLDAHWAVDRHAGHPGPSWPYYALYALERAAIFSRVRAVGGRDWYFEGAFRILRTRRPEGHWDERGADKTVGTCFALLFLKRATAPLGVTTGR